MPTKTELEATVAELEAKNKELAAELKAEQAKPAPKAPKAVDPNGGLLAMVLHVSGADWQGTQKRLVRCATAGPLSEKWMVVKGGKMFTTSGHAADFQPFRHLQSGLQDKVAWDFKAARKYIKEV